MRVWRASQFLALAIVLSVVPAKAQGVGGRWGNLYDTTVMNTPGCPVQLDNRTRARRPNLQPGARFAKPGNIRGNPGLDQIGAELRVVLENLGTAKITEVDVQWRAYNEQDEQVWAYGQIISFGAHPLGQHDYSPGSLFVPAPPKEAVRVTAIIVRVMGESGEICPMRMQATGKAKETESSPVQETATVVGAALAENVAVASVEQSAETACNCRLTTSDQALRVRAAAAKGDSDALLAVGAMYLSGRFEIQNYVLAHAWFNVASAHGQPMGERCRSLVETKLDQREIARAQDEAFKIQKQLSTPAE